MPYILTVDRYKLVESTSLPENNFYFTDEYVLSPVDFCRLSLNFSFSDMLKSKLLENNKKSMLQLKYS